MIEAGRLLVAKTIGRPVPFIKTLGRFCDDRLADLWRPNMTYQKFHFPFLVLVLLFAVSGCGAQPAAVQEAPASAVPTDLPLSPTPVPPTPTQASQALIQLTHCEMQC